MAMVKQMGSVLCTYKPWCMRCRAAHYNEVIGWHACNAEHGVQHLPLLAALYQRHAPGHSDELKQDMSATRMHLQGTLPERDLQQDYQKARVKQMGSNLHACIS